jgi:hypothetical protein
MISDDKKTVAEPTANNTEDQQEKPLENPFNDNNNKEITAEDVKSEQDFKEAQTERD